MNSNVNIVQARSFGMIAVSLDEGASFQAYSCGEEWNRMQCPYFTFEEATKLTQDPDMSGLLKYDAEKDRFVFDDPAYADDPTYKADTFEAETIIVDGKDVKVYAIGAYAWCWHKD